MKERFKWIAVLLGVGLLATACQPKDTRPGLWLSGNRTAEPVSDWHFTDVVEEIFIETRTRYGLRHSTTIWCVALDGSLYIGSYDDEVKFWERNVARNRAARLRIDGLLYDVRVTPIANPELNERLDAGYSAKYDMADVFGDDPPAWRYYRVATAGQDAGS